MIILVHSCQKIRQDLCCLRKAGIGFIQEVEMSFLYNSKHREPGKVVEKQKYLSLE